jgi:hypothetical protein
MIKAFGALALELRSKLLGTVSEACNITAGIGTTVANNYLIQLLLHTN